MRKRIKKNICLIYHLTFIKSLDSCSIEFLSTKILSMEIDIPTIDLTLSTSHSQIQIDTIENDETFSIGKNKIDDQDFKNFNESITGEHKGKTSTNCKLCQ